MLNKSCYLCLQVINDPFFDSKSLEEVKEQIETVFKIELTNDPEDAKICPFCADKLQISLELYQIIIESQNLLSQQKVECNLELVKVEEPTISEKLPVIKLERIIVDDPVLPKLKKKREKTSPKQRKKKEKYDLVEEISLKTEKIDDNEALEDEEKSKSKKNREKDRPLRCNQFIDKAQLDEEDRQIKEFFHFSCEQCSESFERFFLYKNHRYEKHGDPNASIVCCGLRLNKRIRLLDHMIFHTNPSMFKCPDCDKQLQNRTHLRDHRQQHHQLPKRSGVTHQCEICSKTFQRIRTLQNHMDTHLPKHEKEAKKLFLCNECPGVAFKLKAQIARHMRKIHLKLYNFICDICAKTFKNKNDFLYHYRSMHDVKPLPKMKCHLCNALLLNEKCLNAHIARIHKHGGPHECPICGKIAPSSQALRQHRIYVHESERKFKCTHCGKGFKREVEMKEHVTTHIGGALYTCQFCEKTFNSGANMYAHRKRMHPVEHQRMVQEKLNK
ncbi:transcription factor grauzone-like [Culicoides brevitarsis]|uniref:transcription factor grauzone-like n=1 Tax=Culicoides brevitarsis TaxID=469753 RepID=UPI00307C1384